MTQFQQFEPPTLPKAQIHMELLGAVCRSAWNQVGKFCSDMKMTDGAGKGVWQESSCGKN